jgi:hypothetical protein
MPLTPYVYYDNKMLMPHGKTELADTLAVILAASTTYPLGSVLYDSGPGTVNGQLVPSIYAAFNGSGTPSLLLKRACATDASNNVTFGAQGGGMEYGQTYLTADAYYKGLFRTADLPASGAGALTANSITRGNAQQIGNIIQGNMSAGLLLLGA